MIMISAFSVYLGVRGAVAGEMPTLTEARDVTVAWLGLGTAAVFVLGNMALVFIRDILRRKSARAACPPHSHPEIISAVGEVRNLVVAVDRRVTGVMREVDEGWAKEAGRREELRGAITQTRRELNGLRQDVIDGQTNLRKAYHEAEEAAVERDRTTQQILLNISSTLKSAATAAAPVPPADSSSKGEKS